ncbi:TolC family protein [Novosphingobium soli]|uniref:TolC family protein n=1 Tax=Novosphingobium soli TaxID=574956 RepID=A0ABV6CU70_9SPHN
MFVSFSVGAQAQATGQAFGGEALTLEQAVQEAVAWHPSVTEAVGRLKARGEDVRVAQAGYLPQVNAGLGSGYDSVSRSRWRPRANLSASQMLYDFGKVSSSVAIAEAGTRIGRAQLLLAVDSLVRDTAYALIEIQRGAALREVALQQLESVRSISELVDHRFRRGAATRSDALQAQARVQSAEAAIQQIAAEQQRWGSNLAYLVGRDALPPVSAEVPDWFLRSCESGEPDWTQVPAIMQVHASREQAEAELDRSRAEGLPTLSVGAGASTDVNDPLSDRADYNFGISISSALYSGGAYRARTRGAAFALGAADAAEASVRNEVSRLLAEAQRQVDSFRDVLATLVAREESMRETGTLYRLQYLEMGTRTLVDLLNAQQELHQVRFDLVNTRHDEFVRRLREGLQYVVQEGGEGLSGGQVQSLLLARLLIRQPSVVLLDEPTASMDDATERLFIDRFRSWSERRTVVVATHRMRVLDLVDRVIVIHNGQVTLDDSKDAALRAMQGRGRAA